MYFWMLSETTDFRGGGKVYKYHSHVYYTSIHEIVKGNWPWMHDKHIEIPSGRFQNAKKHDTIISKNI